MSLTVLLAVAFVGAALYYVCPLRLRWVLLLLLSYGFYLTCGLSALPFIVLTTLTTWAGALVIARVGESGKAYLRAHKAELTAEAKKAQKARTRSRQRVWFFAVLLLNFGVLFYSLPQYADFSGGIDLVTGIAQLFGIQLAPNFKRPYFSVSLGDFWRRWHISLGAWMRDYVFYPFALTRPVSRMSKALKKKAGTHIARALPAALGNILVFLLVGVWHGAQMNYVLWGLYNGVILAFTALVEPVYKRMNDRLPRLTASGGFHVFRILRTFLVVNIGWYFDRCVRVCDAFAMLHKTFFAFNAQQLFDGTLDTLGLAAKDYRILLIATILLFVVSLMQERGVKIRDFVLSRPLALRWAVLYAFIFFVLATFGGSNVAASGFMYAVF